MVNLATYHSLLEELKPHRALLVAVSKTKSAEAILELYAAGQRDFGENYVQELCDKQKALPSDIRWHFIGHLQRNKVKQIASFVHLIHGVDSLRLLEEINKQALAAGRVIPVLLQMFVAAEESKFGLDRTELDNILTLFNQQQLPGVEIRGIMGMATFTDNRDQVTREFQQLRAYFQMVKIALPDQQVDTLSMGMSSDYKTALACGSTLIRIGSALFGERVKKI